MSKESNTAETTSGGWRRYDSIFAGALAGMLSRYTCLFRNHLTFATRLCIAPLDLIKIRLQLQGPHAEVGSTPSGLIQTVKDIYRQEGLTVSFGNC
jgi:hypothetical protein